MTTTVAQSYRWNGNPSAGIYNNIPCAINGRIRYLNFTSENYTGATAYRLGIMQGTQAAFDATKVLWERFATGTKLFVDFVASQKVDIVVPAANFTVFVVAAVSLTSIWITVTYEEAI